MRRKPTIQTRTGCTGCGVFLAYAANRGRTLIDRRLYLPASWTEDRRRCRRAGIEDTVAFATKVAIAREMLRRAVTEKIPFQWVTADAGYGYSKSWWTELEQAGIFHVMATTRQDTVVTHWAPDHPVHDLYTDLPRQNAEVDRLVLRAPPAPLAGNVLWPSTSSNSRYVKSPEVPPEPSASVLSKPALERSSPMLAVSVPQNVYPAGPSGSTSPSNVADDPNLVLETGSRIRSSERQMRDGSPGLLSRSRDRVRAEVGEGVGEIEPSGEDGGGAGHIQPEPHGRTQGADENEPVAGMGMQQHYQEVLVAVAQTTDIYDEVAAASAGEGGLETGAVDVPDGGYAAQDDQMSGRVIEVGIDDLKFTPRVPADTRTCSSLI